MTQPPGDAAEGRTRHAFWTFLALVYCAFIFWLSATPGSVLNALGLPSWLPNFIHVPLYAGLAALVLMAFSGNLSRLRQGAWPTLWTIGTVATYAVTDEFHQSFVQGRSSTLADVALDLLGMGTALLLLHLIGRRRTPSDLRALGEA